MAMATASLRCSAVGGLCRTALPSKPVRRNLAVRADSGTKGKEQGVDIKDRGQDDSFT